MIRVFISSTLKDLGPEREAVRDAIHGLDLQFGDMNFFGTRSEDPTTVSLLELDECDVYVGLFAQRYGTLDPATGLSITEMEYGHATGRRLPDGRPMPIFIYLRDLAHPMPHTEEYIDFDPEKHARLLCLRKELGERHCPGQFTSVDDLKAKVTTALSLHLQEETRRELDRANRKLAEVRGKAEEGRVAVGLLLRLLARSQLEDGLQAGQVPRLGTAQAEQIRVLEQAVAASLPDSKATDAERAGALVLHGNAAYGERRHVEAIEAYQQAIAVQPDLAWAHSNLGAVLAEVKRYVEAEAAYREALELDPGYAAAYYNLGLLLAEQKRAVEAEVAYRKALELDPGLAMTYGNLGWLHYVQGDSARCVEVTRQGLAIDPTQAWMQFNLALALLASGRLEEARGQYEKGIGVSTELTHFDEAIQDLIDLCAQKPDLPRAHEVLERVQAVREEWLRRHGEAAQGLEHLTQPVLEELPADHRTTQGKERLMDVWPSLISHLEPTKSIHPRKSALHYPAVATEPFTRLNPPTRDAGNDATSPQCLPTAGEVVSLVRVQLGRSLPRPSPGPTNRREGIYRCFQQH